MITLPKKFFYLFCGITNFATIYYSNYLFFYMKHTFGFGDLENLLLAALNGILYTIGSWQAGKFAQKFGNVQALYIGTAGLILALVAGLCFHTAAAQVAVFGFWTVAVCLIWPALEAIVSEQSDNNLSTMVGMYNVTWAGTSAVSYFITGILLEKLGMSSLFWFPLILLSCEIAVLLPLAASLLKKEQRQPVIITRDIPSGRPHYSKKFFHMALLANPFSYIAISTIIPLIPSIAHKMGLSTGLAGITCSVWMFARLAAFFTLWKWKGWHYRFRWLIGAFVIMVLSYASILLAASIPVLLLAQVGFGISIGIIYYSSLYYAMDASDEKGAHGGLHEAMIGSGLFVGPAFGAACLYLFPSSSNITGLPVNALLLIGFVSLTWMGRFRFHKKV